MNMQQSIIGYKDDTREEYIQYHQQAIIRLTVYLTTYGVPNPAPPSINNSGIELLSYHILLALEDLLSFVETRYARYFDPDTWLPQNYLSLTAAELHTELDNLHLNLLAIGVERDFAGIIMQPFWKFAVAQSNSGGTTYSHTSYLKHLKLELEKVIKNGATGNVTKTLHILLNGLNFNSPEYFTYCTKFIQQELKKVEGNDTDELYVLSRFYKYLHQVPVQLGAVLDPSRPALFDLLDEWLRAEREYIEMNIPDGYNSAVGTRRYSRIQNTHGNDHNAVELFFPRPRPDRRNSKQKQIDANTIYGGDLPGHHQGQDVRQQCPQETIRQK